MFYYLFETTRGKNIEPNFSGSPIGLLVPDQQGSFVATGIDITTQPIFLCHLPHHLGVTEECERLSHGSRKFEGLTKT